MPISDCDVRDPRMKRTRQLLQGALRKLLEQRGLDEILVQDIAEAATVNRATFYDHYTDKFALFDAMVASDFHKLLADRNIQFDGSCFSGLAAIIHAVCDYLTEVQSNETECARQRSFTPLMDAAITQAVRRVLLHGLQKSAGQFNLPPEIVASTISWAIYGSAKEWSFSPHRQPAETIVPSLVRLVLPILEGNTSQPLGDDVAGDRRKHDS